MSRFNRGHACEEAPPRSGDLRVSLSPSTALLSAPGGQVVTATVTGGKPSYGYTWGARYEDGTNASGLLSGTGSTRTVSPTTYGQSILVSVSVTDAGTGSASSVQTATASAAVSVGAAPALVSGGDLAATALVAGTTSTSFTFNAATGGAGAVSYALVVVSSTGTVTLSTSSGRTATLNSLTDGATVRVTCTATDSVGQTVSATGVWGVGVAPVYAESALWVPVEEVNFTTIGSGSRSGVGTLTVGSTLLTAWAAAGTPTGVSLSVDSNGARVAQGSGTGTSVFTYVTLPLGLANFAALENVLVDMVFSVESVPTGSLWAVGFGDGNGYGSNDFFGFQSGSATTTDTGNLLGRRFQSGTATTQSLVTATTLSGTYAGQLLLVGQRISMVSLSRASDYLGGPRLGTATPMRGTWSGSPGGAGQGAAATITSALTSMKMSWGPISGAFGVTLKKFRISRLTRPPSV